MQNLVLRMQRPTRFTRPAQWRVGFAVSIFSWAIFSSSAWSATPYSGSGVPWSSGFSPWSMGSTPWSSGFSPWSMGSNPWSSGFSPWSMGSNPWSSGFSPWSMGASPWGGNGWNSSIWPWSGASWGNNSWGNPSWIPWSNHTNGFGRRNNNDWVTGMLLMNTLNNQAPFGTAWLPIYPMQGSTYQNLSTQQPQTLFYPQPPMINQAIPRPNTTNEQMMQPATVGFPATDSSFSPFIEPSHSNPSPTSLPILPSSVDASSPDPKPQAKTWVFPDGSRY
ncbi:MAG: hypothetical protein RLZZ215_86 [Pseudomonadota bacterium]